jgi:endonuclease/exonuclease/phosphatase family metal-dependent hydrolase
MKRACFILAFSLALFSLHAQLATQQREEIKVMTYNIRYDEPADGENRWDMRKDKVAGLMRYYSADFIGTQETQQHQMRYLLANLPAYDCAGRVPQDADSGVEYKSLLYNKEKYTAVSQHVAWLAPDEAKKTTGWDAALIRFYTWSLFRSKKTNKCVWVINAHFDHIGEKARLESARLVWKRIAELRKNNCPVIFIGDLNGLPEEASIQFLDSVMNNTRKISKEPPYGPLDTWNEFRFTSKLDGCYDYIFIEKNGRLAVNKFITITDSYDMKYPSDHLPVMAHITIPYH